MAQPAQRGRAPKTFAGLVWRQVTNHIPHARTHVYAVVLPQVRVANVTNAGAAKSGEMSTNDFFKALEERGYNTQSERKHLIGKTVSSASPGRPCVQGRAPFRQMQSVVWPLSLPPL